MTERVDWELIDAPQEGGAGGARRTPRDAMQAMLGRWWKWKLAGTAAVSLLTLAFFATLTGALVLLFALGTLLAAGVRRLKQWFAAGRRETPPMKL